MNITKDEAEKIAGEFEAKIREAFGPTDYLTPRTMIDICVSSLRSILSPPPKLEWGWRKDLHTWFSGTYWIVPTDAGYFAVYDGCVQDVNHIGTEETLSDAKEFAQGCAEAELRKGASR